MLARLLANWRLITAIVTLGAGLLSMAGVVFFVQSIAAGVADMQATDVRWMDMDDEDTARIIAGIEEIRTTLGVVVGRLDGAGGALWIYELGHRDGAAGCRP